MISPSACTRAAENRAPQPATSPSANIVDFPGKPFWWPEADQAFVEGLKSKIRADIPVVVSDKDVNDPEFSAQVAHTLLEMLS